jgi:hypothetical protein
VEANNGVLWQDDLVAIPRDEEAAGARGVRRRADKVRCVFHSLSSLPRGLAGACCGHSAASTRYTSAPG